MNIAFGSVAEGFPCAPFVYLGCTLKVAYLAFAAAYYQIIGRRLQKFVYPLNVVTGQRGAALYGNSVVAYKAQIFALRPGGYRRLGYVGNNFAVLQLYYPVAVRFGKFPVVRNYYDKLFGGKLFQGVQHLSARCRIKRARRLVGHYYFGFLYKRPGNGNALLLPARKRVGLALCIACKVYLLQNFLYLAPVFAPALQLQGERYVVLNRKFV